MFAPVEPALGDWSCLRDVTSPLHASICHPHASAEAYSRNYPLRFCISRDLEDMPNSPCSNVYTDPGTLPVANHSAGQDV